MLALSCVVVHAMIHFPTTTSDMREVLTAPGLLGITPVRMAVA